MSGTRVPQDDPPMRTEELFQRARAGDDAASSELVARLRDWLRRRFHEKLPSDLRATHSTEDLVQSGFLRAFRPEARFEDRGTGSLRGWLATLVRNELINLQRKHRHEGALRPPGEHGLGAAEEVAADGELDPARLAADADALADLLAFVAGGLGEDERRLFGAFYLDGLRPAEVAERLGVSVEATRRRHRRLLRKIGRWMRRAGRRDQGDGTPR